MSEAADAEVLRLTPLNVGLAAGFVYLLYKLLFGKPRPAHAQKKRANPPKRYFTREELAEYDGTHAIAEHDGEKVIYMAVDGVVFDVTDGAEFYGPGGPYSGFAGKDASRGMARLQIGYTTPEWDDLKDLTETERQTMNDWKDKFLSKYPIRGRLVRNKDDKTNPPVDSVDPLP